MKAITINASKRDTLGKTATKKLINEQKVPCVMYGGENSLHFSADRLAFRNLVYTPNAYTAIIKLDSGEEFNAILQAIQFHPVSDEIIHIDFHEIFENKKVSINIPIEVKGTAPGVLNSGGVLYTNARKLKVRALLKDLPDIITIDISSLELGNKISVKDLINEKYSILHPENMVVCKVGTSRVSMKLEETDEAKEESNTEETTSQNKDTQENKPKEEKGNK